METRKMMKGHKVAAFCKYYVQLRRLAQEQEIENADKLNDRYLYAPANLMPERKFIQIEPLWYMRNYSLLSLMLLFFIFSGVGWLREVCLHMVNHGEFVNRGFLHGPWLPIYGSGGVLILILLKRLRVHPVKEFLSMILLCGVVEYMTSWVLEAVTGGKRWWDYTGYFLNLNGRICAEGLLIFGIGGMIIVYGIAPLLDSFLRRFSTRLLLPICLVLLCLFLGDMAYSAVVPNTGKGVTAPGRTHTSVP